MLSTIKTNELMKKTKHMSAMIVDDDVTLLNSYGELARRFFGNVVMHNNGFDALEQYEKDSFHIVFTDINMPGMSGIELIKKLQQINPEQSFIVMSASDDSQKLIEIIQLGISAFVLKPFKLESFVDTVHNQITIILHKSAEIAEKEEVINKLLDATLEKEKNAEMLIEQSKLAQTGQMINMISHQWRQPLSRITNLISAFKTQVYVGVFSKEGIDKKIILENVMEVFEKIEKTALYLSTTVDDFRNFYRPDKSKVQFNVNEAIRQVVNILMLDEKYTIQYDFCDDSMVSITSFEGEFKQIILNLLNNSKDVLEENNIQSPSIKLSTSATDARIVIRIHDNGGGIKDEILDKIFLPYFSTKSKQTGTGIGLHMVKMIVENHMGGNVFVMNDEDGACFLIDIAKNYDQ